MTVATTAPTMTTMKTAVPAATLGRPHAERLRFDLNEIRAELIQVVQQLTPEQLNQPPVPGAVPDLKSPKQILQEIGTMEGCSRRWITHHELADWGAVWQSLDGDTAEAVLSGLERVRQDTLAFLNGCTEEQIETPIALPEAWYDYFGGATQIEPEELLRWVARHEYYHLGQLNTYAFLHASGSAGAAASTA